MMSRPTTIFFPMTMKIINDIHIFRRRKIPIGEILQDPNQQSLRELYMPTMAEQQQEVKDIVAHADDIKLLIKEVRKKATIRNINL